MTTVVVVEDEPVQLEYVVACLNSVGDGLNVLAAGTGEEAVEFARQHPIDVLLTDVRLPGIDGIEVIRQTLELRPETRVIVMTAFGSPEVRGLAEREGTLDYLEKPFEPEDLRLALATVCSGKRVPSREVGGLDVFDLMEYGESTGETKIFRFRSDDNRGTLVFETGRLVHCSAKSLGGAEAFFEMALWGEGSFKEASGVEIGEYPKNVKQPTSSMVEEAERLLREIGGVKAGPASTNSNQKAAVGQQPAENETRGGSEHPADPLMADPFRVTGNDNGAPTEDRDRTSRTGGETPGPETDFARLAKTLGQEPGVEAWAVVSEQGNLLDGPAKGQLPPLTAFLALRAGRVGAAVGLGDLMSLTVALQDGRTLSVLPCRGRLLVLLTDQSCDTEKLCKRILGDLE